MLFKYNCDMSTPDTFYRITGRPHQEGEKEANTNGGSVTRRCCM